MSFLSKIFGKSKEKKAGIRFSQVPEKKPESTGTILRQPDKATLITKEKKDAELTALEIAEQQDWEVKSLPVWKPGDVILDTYEVEDVISGGMGHVYIANHNKWNVKLAIKSPNEMMLENKSNFARILREANSWTELGLHPNIAYCYYVRNIEDVPHIFVEYVDGGNLRQWIEEGKCIDYRMSLDLAIQFCHGMEHAHSKGMIHRDIKPENILMTQEGVLKITDFGLVRGGDSQQAEDPSIKSDSQAKGSSLTLVGDKMGTWGYMSPEQEESPHEVDERTDIFAFGVCLYEMFCGNRPYEITFGPKQDPQDPVSLSGDESFPAEVGAVLKKAVQWEPGGRYKNFTEIRQELCSIYRELYEEESLYAELELLDLAADGLNNQGVSYFDLGRKEDAVSCWEKALEIKQLHPEATYNLSLVLWRSAKIADDEVLRRLENCSNNPGVDQEILAELKSFIHAERLDFDAARDVLKAIPDRYPTLFSGNNFDRLGSIHTLEEHTDIIWSVAVSADGQYAVSGSNDKTVRVWELESGRCVHILKGHSFGVRSVALSPDSRYILSCSNDKTVRVWELKSGRCVHTLGKHKDFINIVILSPDGSYAVSGSDDKTVRVWELYSGRCVHTLEGHTDKIKSVALSPNGRYLVSGSDDKTIRVWELNSGRCVHSLMGHTNNVYSVLAAPDHRHVLSCSKDKTIRVWELESGRCVHILEGHTDWVYSVVISPDGRNLVSNSADQTMRVWELASGRCIHILKGHTAPVSSVALSPDGLQLVSGSSDNTVRIWEFASGRCVRTLEGHTDTIYSVALNPNSQYAVTGSGDGSVRVWNIITYTPYIADLRVSLLKGFKERKKEEDALEQATSQARTLYEKGDYSNSFSALYEAWKAAGFIKNKGITRLYLNLMKKGRIRGLNLSFQKSLLKGHTQAVWSVALSPHGRYAVSGSSDNTMRVWELKGGRCVHILKGHTDEVEAVALTSDGRCAVSGSRDKTLRVWELKSGRCVNILNGHTDKVEAVALTSDGRCAVSGSWDKTVRVWELSSGQCLHTLEGHTDWIQSVALSPDGLYAVSGSIDKTIRVWELTNLHCVHTLEGHTDSVKSVAISSDGRYVISGSWDKTLRIWELVSGRCLHTLEGHTDMVLSVGLSPDGRYAVSGSGDKTMRVWELSSGRCIYIPEGRVVLPSIVLSPDRRYAVSGSSDKTLRVWEFIWDLEFPVPIDWDEGVRPYLEIFLTLKNGNWTEEDFQELIKELSEKRGYGWVRPEGIRRELEKMSQNWKP